MEAARVAALRGHKVRLWEKSDRLGGLLHYARVPSDKWEIGYLLDYLTGQLKDLGVEVILNKEADGESIIAEGADVVILATGSIPCSLSMQGTSGVEIMTALDMLGGRKSAGEKVVVIGGGTIGCEISSMLVTEGKKVTILEMLEKAGRDIGPTERFIIMSSLKQQGVAIETATRAMEITGAGVVAEKNGNTRIFEADTVIVATGMQPDNGLSLRLAGTGLEFYAIGDCVEPKRIGEAIKSAYRTALKI